MFYGMDDKGLAEGEGRYGFFYDTISLYLGTNPQTLLAMSGSQWIAAIEFVAGI